MFVLLENRSGDVSSMPWRVRGTLVSWANCSMGAQSCATPPHPAAPLCDPPRPARGMYGFWTRQVHRFTKISLVRASGEAFRTRVFDALEGGRDDCLLGELFCRHLVLRGPAPPPRRAPRPDLPVVCPGFGLDRFKRGFCFTIDLNWNSAILASRRTPRRVLCDGLQGCSCGCFLGEVTYVSASSLVSASHLECLSRVSVSRINL